MKSADFLMVGLLGAGVGLGFVLLQAGVRGSPVLPIRSGSANNRRDAVQEPKRRLWLLALLIGAVVWLITGWFAAGLLGVCGAVVLPRAFGGQAARKAYIVKTEAIAAWTELLRDAMAAADGVEEAISASVSVAPPMIRDEVALLDARRRSEQPLTESLTVFGQELDHPSADLVVASLSMAAEGEGSDFVGVLTRLAAITRDEVRMRQQIDAGRAQIRTASRMILAVLAGSVVLLSIVSEGYLTPYGTATGQFWLVIVGAIFSIGILLLERMSRLEMPERFSPRRIPRRAT